MNKGGTIQGVGYYFDEFLSIQKIKLKLKDRINTIIFFIYNPDYFKIEWDKYLEMNNLTKEDKWLTYLPEKKVENIPFVIKEGNLNEVKNEGENNLRDNYED